VTKRWLDSMNKLDAWRGAGREVAVKRLLPDLASDPEYVAMLEQEALVTRRLAHPAIVEVLDAGVADGTPYIVMEYLVGQDLSQIVESSGPLPSSTAIEYVLGPVLVPLVDDPLGLLPLALLLVLVGVDALADRLLDVCDQGLQPGVRIGAEVGVHLLLQVGERRQNVLAVGVQARAHLSERRQGLLVLVQCGLVGHGRQGAGPLPDVGQLSLVHGLVVGLVGVGRNGARDGGFSDGAIDGGLYAGGHELLIHGQVVGVKCSRM